MNLFLTNHYLAGSVSVARMNGLLLGVDFGLSVTDAVVVSSSRIESHTQLHRPGPAGPQVLKRILAELGTGSDASSLIGVTGGRSRELPEQFGNARIRHVGEAEAIGRGGLELTGLNRALVVSGGTGTAMIEADSAAGTYVHRSGTATGGGTLEGLGSKLVGLRNASEIAELALSGDSSAVDTTLAEVLGDGIGQLPLAATAVNLGRLALVAEPQRADLAAGLVTMVGQTISLIALNVALVNGLNQVVFVGRLAGFEAFQAVFRSVFALYGGPEPVFPEGAAAGTALGAALAAASQSS